MDNQRTNEEYLLASTRISNAQEWLNSASNWWEAAYDEVEASYEYLEEIEDDYEEATKVFNASGYDEDFEYVDYTEWEVPDNFDMYFDYGMEDCDEDANTEYCDEECDDDDAYAWCEDDDDADDSADDDADDSADDTPCTDDVAFEDYNFCVGVAPSYCKVDVYEYCMHNDGLGGDATECTPLWYDCIYTSDDQGCYMTWHDCDAMAADATEEDDCKDDYNSCIADY